MQLAPGAVRYVLAVGVLGLLLLLFSPLASVVAFALAVFVAWFFRDPDRDPPETGVLSPADGRVSVVRTEETESGDERLRVGVFMNVHDVHVNRAPIGGDVSAVDHTPGAHRPAFSKDSDRNERLSIEFGDHRVVLIAGAFARRITPYVEPGDTLERGQRLGHISFGSRADVILPAGVGTDSLAVAKGDRVRAGESVIARE